MSARYSDEWKAGLLDPERRFNGLGIDELLESLGLEAGMTVVEYGCGPGLVALQAAVMVGPSGKVYGIDIHEGMVSLVNSRASKAGLTNVTALLKDGPNAPLPGGVANLVTCFLVFHYLEARADRQELADDLARLLKPGGPRGGAPVGPLRSIRGNGRFAYRGRPSVHRPVLRFR